MFLIKTYHPPKSVFCGLVDGWGKQVVPLAGKQRHQSPGNRRLARATARRSDKESVFHTTDKR